ncbi:MAG: galactosyldiacylglycerol synthase [Kofleriaceae bacterium]
MPRLIRLDTGDAIGTITDEQLKFLVDQLEEEHDEDRDYYIDRPTLEVLSDNDIDPELLAMLEKAMGDDDAMDIVWEADDASAAEG